MPCGRVGDAADQAHRRTLRQADGTQACIRRRRRTSAGVGRQCGQAGDHRGEQFADVRCTDRAGIATAELDVTNRRPAEFALVRCRGERGCRGRVDRVARVADAALDSQFVEERLVLDERDDEFAERFINVIAAIDIRRGTTGTAEVTRPRERVGKLRGAIFAILATNREIDGVRGRRDGEAKIAADNSARLSKRGLDQHRRRSNQIIGTFLADRSGGTKEVYRHAARGTGDIVGAGRAGTIRTRAQACCRVGRISCGACTRGQNITASGRTVFRFAIGPVDVPVDRIGDRTAKAGTIIEDRRCKFAGTRTRFNGAPRKVERNRAEVRVGRRRRYCSSSAGRCIKARRVKSRSRSSRVECAELVAQRGWQEGVAQRYGDLRAEHARRRDDRVDRVLREHGTRVDFDRVRDFVPRSCKHVVAAKRRLVDVQWVEVEQRVSRNRAARGGVDLTRPAIPRCRVQARQTSSCIDRAGAGDARRNPRARATKGARERADGVDAEIAVTLIHGIRFLIADREYGVTAVVSEVAADRHVGAKIVAVTLFGHCFADRNLNTSEVAPGDEVHDACNRICTIGGRSATGQSVDAVDEHERNVVQIDEACEARGRDAVAVEKDDVAVCTQAAKVDERSAAVAIVHGRPDAGDDTRNVAQNLLSHVALAKGDFLRRGDQNRRRLRQVRVRNQRTGDDDRIIVIRRVGSRRCALCEGRSGHEGARDDGGRQQIAA